MRKIFVLEDTFKEVLKKKGIDKMKKIALFTIVLLMAIILSPNFSNAATVTVSTEDDLRSKIDNASEGDIIQLTTDIALTKPLDIKEKTLTIDGNGFSIFKNATTWAPDGSNATLITAGLSSKITLYNLTLKNSEKYGAQAYNGGYLVLDGVTIYDCGYGGVLVNAGTVEIKNLNLKHNGLENSNNGIEIAKGKEIDDSHGSNQPKVIMNGVLNSTETTNVIYLATNDKLTEFTVDNTENTENKILLSGNKVVVTNQNNEVIFESNENNQIQLEGETFAANVTITINLNDKVATVVVQEGTLITADELTSKIDLATLDLTNYTIAGYFTNAEYTTEFDFTKPITTDTVVYAKLDEIKQKDETPKTGIENNIGIALFIIALSTIALIALKRKNI